MLEIIKSETYEDWIAKLEDRQAVAKINARIRRVADYGHFGDVKPVREGVSEMRIDMFRYGPGYRLYFMQKGAVIVVLLAGGDKSTQKADIKRAVEVTKEWKD